MDQSHDDPINVLCELAEASGDRFQAADLESRYGSALRALADLGAIEAGDPLRTLTCRACDEDHSVTVKFDTATRRNWHFCAVAGVVTVNDADLATFRFNPGWLVEWLIQAFPIFPPVRRRELVPDHVWHLGDALCGETSITVIYARRVSSQAALDQLAVVLRSVHPADKGLVVTTSPHVPHQIRLPNRYEFLDLRDIVKIGPGGLTLDIARVGSWIRSTPSTSGKGATSRSGRPSLGARIAEIYRERRAAGLPVVNDSAEARDILKLLGQGVPDQELPKLPTVRRHVASVRTEGHSL